MKLYLLIRYGYEGIEEIIMPASKPLILVNKINDIRNKIKEFTKRRKELQKTNETPYGEENIWDQMYQDDKITPEEWELSYANEKFYCIQKWDSKEFKCCCKELNVNIDNNIILV